MADVIRNVLLVTVLVFVKGHQLQDFDFGSDEVMIAQESRQYRSIKPAIKIIKPTGDTNSHRPQFNQASSEIEDLEDPMETSTKRTIRNYKSSATIRSKEGMVKDAILKALQSEDHMEKLVEMLPMIRAMSETQKKALISLVARHVSASPENKLISLSQVF